jgi:hypothetical protein
MSKPLLVISCPADTHSGYGARARDLIWALQKYDKFEIKTLSQRWGATPFGFLKPEVPEHKAILDTFLDNGQIPGKPDIWIQLTVPNEFQAVGEYNIGITAGIETTVCDPSWIDGCNRMNLILVSSNHAKQVFESTKVINKATNVETVVKTPIEVLFEGVDLDKYFHMEDTDIPENDVVEALDNIDENFNFLFVGHWLQGELGEDRKNVGMMIKSFLETFKNKKNKPGLILKTNSATTSIMDREETLKKINDVRNLVKGTLPNIYLLHGELEDEEMNYLYNHPKVKAFISLTKGEGFGRPLLEFTLSKKPIIASGWSGHTDFLDKDFAILVGGELKPVHHSAQVKDMILAEAHWFTPDYVEVGNILTDVYANYDKYTPRAKRQAHKSKTDFNFDKMAELLDIIFETRIPKRVEMKMPVLRKLEIPKL